MKVKHFLQVHVPSHPEGNMQKVWKIARKTTSASDKSSTEQKRLTV